MMMLILYSNFFSQYKKLFYEIRYFVYILLELIILREWYISIILQEHDVAATKLFFFILFFLDYVGLKINWDRAGILGN